MEGTSEEGIEEKLSRARERKRQAEVSFFIPWIIGFFIFLVSGPHRSNIAIAISGLFFAIGLAGTLLWWNYAELVEKYEEQLEGYLKEKSKKDLEEDPLKVLKSRLGKGEITKEEYEKIKKKLNVKMKHF